MAYCTPTQVRDIIDTELGDEQLTRLIVIADSDLDDLLQGAVMSAVQKQKCSMRLTAIAAANRAPKKESTADLQLDYSGQIAQWQREVDASVALVKADAESSEHVAVSSYGEIDEDE